MGWIRDKLSLLIEEGKKALKCDIVIMSDAKEDIYIGTDCVWRGTGSRGTRRRNIVQYNG